MNVRGYYSPSASNGSLTFHAGPFCAQTGSESLWQVTMKQLPLPVLPAPPHHRGVQANWLVGSELSSPQFTAHSRRP